MKHGWIFLAIWAYSVAAPRLAAAQEEVAIEVPVAESYDVAGDGLEEIDGAGEASPLAPRLRLRACGQQLCAPLEDALLPFKITSRRPVSVNGRLLQGSLWVTLQKGRLVLINRIALEDYLVATVGSEMPKTFPLEALKAQAVAARTYAMSRKLMREGAAVHLSSSTLDQVYGGLRHESPETRAAVSATAGEILVYARAPIDAYFFASCNGRTRDAAPVFGEHPYLHSVTCGYCNDAHFAHWRLVLSRVELKKRLGEEVTGLKRGAALPNGRAQYYALEPSGRRHAPEALRKLIGYTELKSADFDVTCNGKECVFEGRGAGHGVGMCQWGARGMAMQGRGYREILTHYFAGAEIKKLY